MICDAQYQKDPNCTDVEYITNNSFLLRAASNDHKDLAGQLDDLKNKSKDSKTKPKLHATRSDDF